MASSRLALRRVRRYPWTEHLVAGEGQKSQSSPARPRAMCGARCAPVDEAATAPAAMCLRDHFANWVIVPNASRPAPARRVRSARPSISSGPPRERISPRSSIGATRRMAPFSAASICQGTHVRVVLEGPRRRSQSPARRLGDVGLRHRLMDSVSAAGIHNLRRRGCVQELADRFRGRPRRRRGALARIGARRGGRWPRPVRRRMIASSTARGPSARWRVIEIDERMAMHGLPERGEISRMRPRPGPTCVSMRALMFRGPFSTPSGAREAHANDSTRIFCQKCRSRKAVK